MAVEEVVENAPDEPVAPSLPMRSDARTFGQQRDGSLLFLLTGLALVELSWLAALAYAVYRVLM